MGDSFLQIILFPLFLLVMAQFFFFWLCGVLLVTRQTSLTVVEYTYHYAKSNDMERVSVILKANIIEENKWTSTPGLMTNPKRQL